MTDGNVCCVCVCVCVCVCAAKWDAEAENLVFKSWHLYLAAL